MKFIIVLQFCVLLCHGVLSYKRHSSGDHNPNKRYHVTKTKVIMPSGKMFLINTPSPRGNCKPELITLHAKDRKWRNEYTIVKKELENTQGVPLGTFTGFKNVKIQKVLNPCLWQKYQYRKMQVVREAQNINERMLFHASAASHTDTEKGFNERYTKLSGRYGAGLYFADKSFKSHLDAKARPGTTARIIMLCRVVLGKSYNVTAPTHLAHPPVGFQSVVGSDGTFAEYVIFRGEQAYPEYLITYKST